MYAVVDVETTGLRPSWHDRICEIAIVHVDGTGEVTDRWASLINPNRDLGPQHVHGISAAEARRAPTFADLAGEIVQRLRGRVIAAHNLAFDARFIEAEFDRIGARAPVTVDAGLCTMRLAPQFLPNAGRSLRDCCEAAGVELVNAHSAIYDAVAAAGLLRSYLGATGASPSWQRLVDAAARQAWPSFPDIAVAAVPRQHDGHVAEHFLAQLVDRLPRVAEPPEADTYLCLLDQALIDRHISMTEAEALVEMAQLLHLSRSAVATLHGQYLRVLAEEAADDGVVSDAELADLHAVALLLGLAETDVVQALSSPTTDVTNAVSSRVTVRFVLNRDDQVVFTGQMAQAREVWENMALRAGLKVGRSVTRQTRLLVAADPDTMSGKARQARRYLIPIVHPAAFLTMLPASNN